MPADKVVLHNWSDIPPEFVTPFIDRKLVTGDQLMIAQVFLKKGAIVPRHQHHNEQVTYILEGALRFWIGEDESQVVDVPAGSVLTIPSNLPHKAEALEDTLDLDVFTPPREDWLNKTDDYLRQGNK
ncbi:MAG: cupin domain-containing protein [Gemmatimonadaceae bacterium]